MKRELRIKNGLLKFDVHKSDMYLSFHPDTSNDNYQFTLLSHTFSTFYKIIISLKSGLQPVLFITGDGQQLNLQRLDNTYQILLKISGKPLVTLNLSVMQMNYFLNLMNFTLPSSE